MLCFPLGVARMLLQGAIEIKRVHAIIQAIRWQPTCVDRLQLGVPTPGHVLQHMHDNAPSLLARRRAFALMQTETLETHHMTNIGIVVNSTLHAVASSEYFQQTCAKRMRLIG